MARGKEQPTSTQGWFTKYFKDHPQALSTRSNTEVIQAWNNAHPDRPFDRSVQSAMTNAKSNQRSKQGIKPSAKRKKKKGAAKAVAMDGAAPKPARAGVGSGTLQGLELAIDRCLETARALEARDDDAGHVVNHLRSARNWVVWMLGKP
jgi:hypothetical protein